MNGWVTNPVGGYTLVATLSAVLLVVLLLTSRDLRRLKPGRRWTLVTLRVLVFLAVIAAMLRPTRIYTEIRQQPATLVLLVDRSRSMQTKDAFGERTRWQAVRQVLGDAAGQLADMGDNLEVKVYAFDRDVTPLDLASGTLKLDESAAGDQTALGAALEDVLRRERGKRLAGVIVLSDGAQQAYAPRDLQPQTPARQLNDLPAPLFTLNFGQDRSADQSRDAALTDLVVSPSVFIKNELSIGGTARFTGLENKTIPVQLMFETEPGKMEPVETLELKPKQNGEQLRFELSYIPQSRGERKLSLRIKPQDDERITTNNELSTFVNVLDGGLNVLYLEGEPRVEQRFIRRALAASPDINVDFIWFDKRDRARRWPVDLADQLTAGKYNVVIIGDLDSTAFRPEDLQRLAEAVNQGTGLMMLGGFHSFAAGGYLNTPLAAVLPLERTRADDLARQDFDAPIRADVHLPPQPLPSGKNGLPMLPDARFGYEPPMRLAGRDSNRAAWEKLPPLEGANKLEKLKPAAKPLAVTPDGKPLLVAAEPGNGRVLAFAGDSTWRWWMQGFEREHKRFWRQVVLWLARKEESDEQNVWLRLAQRRFAPGARIDFTTGAKTTEGEPIAGALFEANLMSSDGQRRSIALNRQTEQLTGTLRDVTEPGDYTIVVSATKDGVPLGEAKARFTVYQQDLELENAAARPELMASLAKMTATSGGEAVPPEQFVELLARIKNQPRDREVETEAKFTPWDRGEFFLLVVGLLCLEWFLRKKWGLV